MTQNLINIMFSPVFYCSKAEVNKSLCLYYKITQYIAEISRVKVLQDLSYFEIFNKSQAGNNEILKYELLMQKVYLE